MAIDDPTSSNSDTEPSFKVHKNVETGRFELTSPSGDVLSYATFSETGRLVTVPLVFTPPEYRNAGHAGTLMAGLLDLIRADNQQISPVCPYAATYIKRHPEYRELAV